MSMRLLIVDDEQHILTILKAFLSESGYLVETATDGVQAMDLLVRNPPDLILADVMMPNLDGYYLCQMIRSHPETRHIPFIFLSAKAQISDRIEGLKAGADDYITKPFHLDEVKARIEAVLSRSQRHQAMRKQKREAVSKELAALQSRMGEVMHQIERTIVRTKSPASNMTEVIAGNIQEINLIDIIQILNRAQKSGVLRVRSDGQQGILHFQRGNLVDARFEDLSGKEAAFALLCWEQGTFEFDATATSRAKSIDTPLENLLLEAMQRIDETRNG